MITEELPLSSPAVQHVCEIAELSADDLAAGLASKDPITRKLCTASMVLSSMQFDLPIFTKLYARKFLETAVLVGNEKGLHHQRIYCQKFRQRIGYSLHHTEILVHWSQGFGFYVYVEVSVGFTSNRFCEVNMFLRYGSERGSSGLELAKEISRQIYKCWLRHNIPEKALDIARGSLSQVKSIQLKGRKTPFLTTIPPSSLHTGVASLGMIKVRNLEFLEGFLLYEFLKDFTQTQLRREVVLPTMTAHERLAAQIAVSKHPNNEHVEHFLGLFAPQPAGTT